MCVRQLVSVLRWLVFLIPVNNHRQVDEIFSAKLQQDLKENGKMFDHKTSIVNVSVQRQVRSFLAVFPDVPLEKLRQM